MRKIINHRWCCVLSAALLPIGAEATDRTLTNAALPSAESIVQQVVSRALTNEDSNTARFNTRYAYTRLRTWEYHNEAGELTKVKDKQTEENTSPTDGTNDVEALVHGRDLKLGSYPVSNIVSRFEFTLKGREILNGRAAYVLDFVPRKNLPVKHLLDPLINQTAGRVWVDEADYAIIKGRFHLLSPVDVVGGVAGRLTKFSCSFDRVRTPEGCWVVQRIDWHREGRLVLVTRIVDYHEQRIHQRLMPDR